MKTKIIMFFTLLSLMILTACSDEHSDVRPGLWTSKDVIETYPGDTVTIDGQASCYCGLKEVRIECPAWGVNRVYDVSIQKPNVWNFSYLLSVPADATFDQTLLVTAVDKNGSEQKKSISVIYVPATDLPIISGLDTEIAVNYDMNSHSGTYNMSAVVSAVGILDHAVISIPAIGVEEKVSLSGRGARIDKSYVFPEAGTFPMTVTVYDRCGNQTSLEAYIYVLPNENEDSVDDYERMYIFCGNEKSEDYIYGYYQYMQRMDAYCYQVSVYAESDDTEFFFSPTMNDNGERKFGTSPYVSTKIISKQSESGYVKGYKPGKGYWGLWLDVQNQTVSKWALDTADGDKSTLYYSADWNGWGFTEMSTGTATCQKTADCTIYAGNQYFCFATATDWTNIWRTWDDDSSIAGWWFSEDGSGSGATLPTISADVEVHMTFDTLTKWCFIKKK